MSARLEEFLDEWSSNALTKVSIAIDVEEELRIASAVLYPGPAPQPMTMPTVTLPESEVETKVLDIPKTLARLKIDRVNVKLTNGEMCPGCQKTRLGWYSVQWPGGRRPAGGPEAAWWCKWCRQYYIEQ